MWCVLACMSGWDWLDCANQIIQSNGELLDRTECNFILFKCIYGQTNRMLAGLLSCRRHLPREHLKHELTRIESVFYLAIVYVQSWSRHLLVNISINDCNSFAFVYYIFWRIVAVTCIREGKSTGLEYYISNIRNQLCVCY